MTIDDFLAILVAITLVLAAIVGVYKYSHNVDNLVEQYKLELKSQK